MCDESEQETDRFGRFRHTLLISSPTLVEVRVVTLGLAGVRMSGKGRMNQVSCLHLDKRLVSTA